MLTIKSMKYSRRLPRLLALLVGMTVLVSWSNRAFAIFDMGFGFGFGMHQVPSPTGFLNQHALIRAGAGPQGVPTRTPYANNPNSYINRIRDNGFVSHYDTRRRRAPTYRAESTASLGNTGRAEPQPAAASAVLPLASFFDAARKFTWPSDSPASGDLIAKRDASDQAIGAVFEETKQQSMASLSSVAHARQKLLDYGQPALREIRAQATPPIADTFHRFLLAIYDSLAQAAEPTAGTSSSP